MGMFVYSKKYYHITPSQNIAKYNLVISFRKIMIENSIHLFVFE